jgi:aryl-alcohol dehydrogenase-like predicted oxidoreductase
MTVIDTAEMYADGAATHTLPRALINRPGRGRIEHP